MDTEAPGHKACHGHRHSTVHPNITKGCLALLFMHLLEPLCVPCLLRNAFFFCLTPVCSPC
eukprot:1149404-Pelagomonas_calceolata.AAC.3